MDMYLNSLTIPQSHHHRLHTSYYSVIYFSCFMNLMTLSAYYLAVTYYSHLMPLQTRSYHAWACSQSVKTASCPGVRADFPAGTP